MRPERGWDRWLWKVVRGVLILACAGLPARADADRAMVDLELVLAVDVSGSMSVAELLVQRQGYVAALRHPDVAAALAIRGGVALAYVEWAGSNDQRVVVPWTVVADGAAAARFAGRLAAASLRPGFNSPAWMTGTSISHALLFAAGMFNNSLSSRVIDISGNGPNNTGGSLALVRDWVVAQGITVNGLSMAEHGGDFPIADYYENCVIGGQGAFALSVDEPEAFASTLRRKMVLEIATSLPWFTLAGWETPLAPPIDCASSEAAH